MKMVAKIIKEDSIIQFSVKAFFALVFSIMSIFFGFYLLIIQPQFKEQAEKIEKNRVEQLVINKELSTSINQLNVTLSALNESINNLKNDKK